MFPGIQPLNSDDPREFGGWTLEGVIGVGGFSRIFLGSKNGQLAALKMLKKDFLDIEDTFSRFALEISNLMLLSHPNIANYIEHDISTGVPYLATQYIPGQTLDEYIKKSGPISGHEWLDLASSLAKTLDYCHSQKVIHKDISPLNIVMGDSGPVFIDFGLSRLTGDPDKSAYGRATGTFPFMAPEHFSSERTPAMDSFSLAGVLIFAGTGHYPFNGDTTNEWMQAIPSLAPNFEGLTKNQIDVLTPLLYKSPIDRVPLSIFIEIIGLIKLDNQLPELLQAKLDKYLTNSEEKLIFKRIGVEKKKSKSKSKLGIFVLTTAMAMASLFYILANNIGSDQVKSSGLSPSIGNQSTETLNNANQPSASPAPGSSSYECQELFLANSKDAEKACKAASDKGDDRSTYYLAAIYDQNGQKNEAETYYLKAVKLYKDDTKSMLGLVQIYLDRKDDKNYNAWVEKCANYPVKTTSSARCKLLFGIDQIDAGQPKVGIAYLSDSFDWGNTFAGTFLGKYYEKEKNDAKALYWFEAATEEGDPEARKSLIALSYDLGKFDVFKKWITQSANEGNVTDIGRLALYLTIGDKNYVEGKKWGLIGAEAGDGVSMFAAGYSYYKGDKNIPKAKIWLLKSAKLNNALSARVLGEIYRDEKNPTEAIFWYQKESLSEDLTSSYELSMIYLNDLKNVSEACKYFRNTLTLAEKLKSSRGTLSSSDQKLQDNSKTGLATFCS